MQRNKLDFAFFLSVSQKKKFRITLYLMFKEIAYLSLAAVVFAVVYLRDKLFSDFDCCFRNNTFQIYTVIFGINIFRISLVFS